MQKTVSKLEYTRQKKQTCHDRFLADLEQLAPWSLLKIDWKKPI